MTDTYLGALRTKEYDGGRPGPHTKKSKTLPLPTALLLREVVDSAMTLVEQRLLHAILYLSWEAMLIPAQPVQLIGAELRQVIGHFDAESNSAIRAGFSRLASRRLRIHSRWQSNTIIEAPILSRWHYCINSKCFWWVMSPAIEEWCSYDFTFGRVDLDVVAALRTPAAIRLYELCCALRKREFPHKLIDVSAFRKFFDCSTRYPKFSQFEARVVAPALREVNTTSPFDVDLEWRESRRGASYDQVRVVVGMKSSDPTRRLIETRGPVRHSELPASDTCACCLPR